MGKQIGQSANSGTRHPLPRSDEPEPPADPIRARRVRPLRRSLATCEVLRGLAYSAARSRMLSELAPMMTTILSLIPGMKFCFLRSPFTFDMPASYFFLRDCKAATPPCAQHPLAFGTTNQRRVIHFAAGSRATSSEIARQLQIKSRAASSFVVASRWVTDCAWSHTASISRVSVPRESETADCSTNTRASRFTLAA